MYFCLPHFEVMSFADDEQLSCEYFTKDAVYVFLYPIVERGNYVEMMVGTFYGHQQ